MPKLSKGKPMTNPTPTDAMVEAVQTAVNDGDDCFWIDGDAGASLTAEGAKVAIQAALAAQDTEPVEFPPEPNEKDRQNAVALVALAGNIDDVAAALAVHRLTYSNYTFDHPAPEQGEGLVDDLETEADLCRNEGAEDIANLLDRAITALRASGQGDLRASVIEECAKVAEGYRTKIIGIPSAAVDDTAEWIAKDIRDLAAQERKSNETP